MDHECEEAICYITEIWLGEGRPGRNIHATELSPAEQKPRVMSLPDRQQMIPNLHCHVKTCHELYSNLPHQLLSASSPPPCLNPQDICKQLQLQLEDTKIIQEP